MTKICNMKELVTALGGTCKLAKKLGLGAPSVSNMIADNYVYAPHQLKIYLMCKNEKVEICPELLGLKKTDCGSEAA